MLSSEKMNKNLPNSSHESLYLLVDQLLAARARITFKRKIFCPPKTQAHVRTTLCKNWLVYSIANLVLYFSSKIDIKKSLIRRLFDFCINFHHDSSLQLAPSITLSLKLTRLGIFLIVSKLDTCHRSLSTDFCKKMLKISFQGLVFYFLLETREE